MTTLSQSHVFGLVGSVPNALHYLDDQHILYPAGSSIIVYNVEQKSQRFISLSEGGSVTALTSSSRLIAVAEKGEKKAVVTIFDAHTLKKKKLLRDDDAAQNCKEIVSVALSNDNKFLLTQSAEPDWHLQLWNWEKGKVYGSLKLNYAANVRVLQVSFNPFDKNVPQLCVVGHNIFRIYRYTEGTLKPMTFQKTDHRNNMAHAWLSSERIAVSTDDGKLLIYENAELKLELMAGLTNEVHVRPHYLTCLRAGQNGFIAGSNNGFVQVWERADDSTLYRSAKEVKVENAVIRGIAISSNEDSAVCSLENNQLIALTSLQSDDIKVEKLSQAHHSAITGLDVCIRKPLLATCGADQSVRVWNFLENTMEIAKFFKSEPYSIAFHPSGLFLLVGFAEGIKLLKILLDDIRPYWEYNARGCRECRFSNGGQYFVVAHENIVTVRSTWSFDLIVTLKGHAGKVRSVAWSNDDCRLLTVAHDGVVIEWDLRTQRRVSEQSHPSQFQTAIFSAEKAMYVGTGDGKVIEVRESQIAREINVHASVSQLCVGRSGKLVVAATATGHVKAIRYPPPAAADVISLHTHNAPITRLRMSFDEQFLFTTSSDGSLCIVRIHDKELRGGAGSKRDRVGDTAYSDEILALRSDVKDQLKVMNDLRQKVEEIRLENERVLEQRELTYSQKARETTERFAHDIEALATENEVLRQAYETSVIANGKRLAELRDKHMTERRKLEEGTKFKLKAEEERYRALEEALEAKRGQWHGHMNLIRNSLDEELDALRDFYSKRIEEKEIEMRGLEADLGQRRTDFLSKSLDIDSSTDQEVLQLQYYYEQRLKDERISLKQIQQENEEMHKKYDALLKKIESNKVEIQKMSQEERKLTAIIKTLEKDISGARRELQEREDTIEDKEKRISDLKKKNKELEKFKFVLDYKIVELRKQIEPREQDIVRLQGQLADMDVELAGYLKARSAMRFTRDDLLQKLAGTERELEVQQRRTAVARLVVDTLHRDVLALSQHVRDPNSLKRSVRALFHKYCGQPDPPESSVADLQDTPPASPAKAKPHISSAPGRLGSNTEDGASSSSAAATPQRRKQTRSRNKPGAFTDERDQELRQRDLLEKTLSTVQRKFTKQVAARENETQKLIDENVQLTSEVNKLRKELMSISL
ncbi:Cilia- and flagella-associated protein 57 [Blastocladiella emersonii ATCC 22665]|nr:Cilia- and flagella-associated protein 57 [Blastocladiella emersonii ATCC 22665]